MCLCVPWCEHMRVLWYAHDVGPKHPSAVSLVPPLQARILMLHPPPHLESNALFITSRLSVSTMSKPASEWISPPSHVLRVERHLHRHTLSLRYAVETSDAVWYP